MNQSKSILVAVDFSACSADALQQAVRIARWNQAKVHAVHVVDMPNMQPTPHFLFPFPPPTQWDLVAHARSRWDEFAMAAIGTEQVEFDIAVGSPRSEILERVHRLKPDVLVMGAHSILDARKGVGTTAAACVRKAETKVLLVRRQQSGPFRNVAASIDFSPVSRLVLEQAIRVAAQDHANLHVVHVYDDPWCGLPPSDAVVANMPDFKGKLRQSVEKRLKGFCAASAHELGALHAQFHGVEHMEEWAGCGRGIVQFVGEREIDLVVLGTRSSWNIRDFVMGSTAERVVRDAGCSILAIKPEPEPSTDESLNESKIQKSAPTGHGVKGR